MFLSTFKSQLNQNGFFVWFFLGMVNATTLINRDANLVLNNNFEVVTIKMASHSHSHTQLSLFFYSLRKTIFFVFVLLEKKTKVFQKVLVNLLVFFCLTQPTVSHKYKYCFALSERARAHARPFCANTRARLFFSFFVWQGCQIQTN